MQLRAFRFWLLVCGIIMVFPTMAGAGAAITPVPLAAGDYHSLAIKAGGSLWAWGYNHNGQLGLGDTNDRHSPVQVQWPSSPFAIIPALNLLLGG